jgi:CBS domain-containing protein
MRAGDIMTRAVTTVGPHDTIREIASLLLERRISGVPVVEGGRMIGIVSEGDLLRRHEIGTQRKRAGSWWMRLFRGEPGPAEYVKSHAVHAVDVMSTPVISVAEDEAVANIASLFGRRRIKRVPVLRDGRLVGIVTRANLVQALAAVHPPHACASADDDAIRARLLEELETQAWWRADSNALVHAGVVHYWGACEDEDEKRAARVAAQNIPGVRGVEDHRALYAELPYTMG